METTVSTESLPEFTTMIDLAAEKFGGRTLLASDDFFAEKENLLKPGRGVFIADKYTENGKWMDGWESRRKRDMGNDWCILKLGMPGVVWGVDIDTNHFTGNYPEHASIDAIAVSGDPSGEELAARKDWTRILPIEKLEGGSRNLFEILDDARSSPPSGRRRWTHLRLNIYPDGGVARFRVHGQVVPDAEHLTGRLDLAAAVNGGVAIYASDMYFGNRNNLIMPDRAAHMGEGWETRRRRGPGNDWIVVKLAAPGVIEEIEVDTNHFKGNFPESCSLEGIYLEEVDAPPEFLTNRNLPWTEILSRTKLQAHHQHYYKDLQAAGPFTHVRLNIFPDGGVSRLRLMGRVAPGGAQ